MTGSRVHPSADGNDARLSPTRRVLLQAGAAASLVPATMAAGAAGAPMAATATADIYKVIFQNDHPAAVDFGRAAQAAGYRTHAVGQDVTALWYHDLYHRWRDGPAAIAGLTSISVAMCLELMAWDAGLRTVFRADHKPTAEGGIRHLLTGPAALLERAALLDTGAAWGTGASRLLSRCPAAGQPRTTLTVECAATPGLSHAEPLVSWVFAPVRRA